MPKEVEKGYKLIKKIEEPEIFNADTYHANPNTLQISIPKSVVEIHGIRKGQKLKLQLLAIYEPSEE